jgi:hypothetical protein
MHCLVVFLFFYLGGPGILWAKPIEIYVNGARYESVDDYKAHAIVSLRETPPLAGLTPQTRHALDNISLEYAIGRVMADFDQNWEDPVPKFTISAAQLEDCLRALVADRPEPVLLILGPQKLRVAAYTGPAQGETQESP